MQKLEAAGLGEIRLLKELDSKLQAKVTKYYQDQSLGDHEDNTTQMRATELLAELLGKRKTSVEHSGPGGVPLSIQYELVQPDADDEKSSKD